MLLSLLQLTGEDNSWFRHCTSKHTESSSSSVASIPSSNLQWLPSRPNNQSLQHEANWAQYIVPIYIDLYSGLVWLPCCTNFHEQTSQVLISWGFSLRLQCDCLCSTQPRLIQLSPSRYCSSYMHPVLRLSFCEQWCTTALYVLDAFSLLLLDPPLTLALCPLFSIL